jgi:hypothetical protein
MPRDDIAATDTSGQVDEATVVDPEESLANADISFEEDDDTDEAFGDESDDTEDETAATDSDTDDTEESDDSTDESEEVTTTDDVPDEQSDEVPSEATERQKQNDEAAKRRIAEREARREAKLQASQDFLDKAEDNQDLVLRQLQIDTHNNKVAQVSNKLEGDLNRVMASIDLFTSKDPVIQEAMLDAVDTYDALHVKRDEFGDPIEVTGDMHDYLSKEAARIRKLTGIGARQQEQAKNTQKKRTLTTPTRTPAKAKTDPLLDGFDEEAAK